MFEISETHDVECFNYNNSFDLDVVCAAICPDFSERLTM